MKHDWERRTDSAKKDGRGGETNSPELAVVVWGGGKDERYIVRRWEG